jgi:hypothetical protein
VSVFIPSAVGFSLQLQARTFLHFVLSCFVFFLAAVIFRLDALSHISPAHRREHFEAAATGTIAEAARLDFEWTSRPMPTIAQGQITVNLWQ